MSGPAVTRGDAVRVVTPAAVVVPLGNWAASELALAPAGDLAGRIGADLHLLSVGIEESEAEEMARRLATLAEGFGATAETRVDYDVPAVILEVAREQEPALVCMASHGRGRLSGALLGSNTAAVLAAAPSPVLLAGPHLDPRRRLAERSVVACVDGSEPSEAGVAVAAGWATMLGVPLEILTVAEPGLERPAGYVEALVQACERPGLQVTGLTIREASPADAIVAHAGRAPTGLLVATTHARTGLRRMAFGSVAASIVRSSPVPVLAVRPTGA